MTSSRIYFGLALVLAGSVFFVNLGQARLWDRDEPRNAGCAREMLERHDWVVPVFNGELRDHKPVLLYWFMMLAYSVFGINEFAARFFSALFGLGTVAITYDLGRRAFRPEVGFWAALMLATCMMFPVAARAATPDSVLIFFSTAALWLYAQGYVLAPSGAGASRSGTGLVLASYASMGLAVLAKGPIGFLLPAGIIGLYHMVEEPLPRGDGLPRFARWLAGIRELLHPARILAAVRKMFLLPGLLVTLAVAMPWYIWVGMRTNGEWLKGFFLTHNVGRFLHPMEDHSGPIFYYPLVLFACFFPWALFLISALAQGIKTAQSTKPPGRFMRFLLIWAAVYIVFFSLAGTKLPNYITPSLPAFALVTAWWLDAWLRGSESNRRSPYAVAWILTGSGLVVAVAIPIAAHIFLPGEEILGILGLVWLAGGVACLLALRRGQRLGFMVALATAAWVFVVGLFGVAAVRVSCHQRFDYLAGILRELRTSSQEPVTVAAYDSLEPSWVFYLGQPIQFLPASQGPDRIRDLAKSGDFCLLVTRKRYEQICEKLGRDLVPIAGVPYFLKKHEEILLLGTSEVLAKLDQPAARSGPDHTAEAAPAGGTVHRR
ncbi:ArnT family glycosyltransferase [Thermogutta sp.]|uniref:ArnT family glycosyltransferase n=1 Tax=Thermogutta sp. TaxID=1962930 RepID=UPI003C7D80C2